MTQRARIHPNDIAAINLLIADIQALESRAHRLMMVGAALALNKAKNRAGWELAEQIERIGADDGDEPSPMTT